MDSETALVTSHRSGSAAHAALHANVEGRTACPRILYCLIDRSEALEEDFLILLFNRIFRNWDYSVPKLKQLSGIPFD